MTYKTDQQVNFRGYCYKISRQEPDGRWLIYPRRRSRATRHSLTVDADNLSPWIEPIRKARTGAICQCCGRQIEAKNGTIAHHGYIRPGSGWQTPSCVGAKFPPFQVSRDRLEWMIEEVIKPYLERCEANIAALAVDGVHVPGPSVVKIGPNGPMYDRNGRKVTHNPLIGPDFVPAKPWQHKYSDYLRFARANAENERSHVQDDLAAQQKRYDGWKPVPGWRP